MYNLKTNSERRLLLLLALTQFTIIMDAMVMMPLGPQIMQEFQITAPSFATAVSVYSWCSGLSALFGASYIDRFDRRRLLLIVYALFALSNLACACAPTFGLLLAARGFAGITGGVLGSIVMAIVSDVIPMARRGAATATVMTAYSISAAIGVPLGILLGSHFGWFSPFLLLVALSVLFWLAAVCIVPSLKEHLERHATTRTAVLWRLWGPMSKPRHFNAFALTFIVMASQMMVIPFISPMLVANRGVPPLQLSWMFMAGGIATLFTARHIGRLSDRYGNLRVFRWVAALSILPILLITHLPSLPFVGTVLVHTLFMIAVSGRLIPMQAMLTTVPDPANRGAFLSANGALQALGMGCGAWFGGLLLSGSTNGTFQGYGLDGWLSAGLVMMGLVWASRVIAASGGSRAKLGLGINSQPGTVATGVVQPRVTVE